METKMIWFHIVYLLYIYVVNCTFFSIRLELNRSLGIDKCARARFIWFKCTVMKYEEIQYVWYVAVPTYPYGKKRSTCRRAPKCLSLRIYFFFALQCSEFGLSKRNFVSGHTKKNDRLFMAHRNIKAALAFGNKKLWKCGNHMFYTQNQITIIFISAAEYFWCCFLSFFSFMRKSAFQPQMTKKMFLNFIFFWFFFWWEA